MILAEREIDFGGSKLRLNSKRSIFWEHEKMLILSDVHLGKSAHFRKNGLAMPNHLHIKDVNTLTDLLNHYAPKILMMVGDLVHAEMNREVEDFCRWKEQFPETLFYLVKGNHDRLGKEVLEALALDFYGDDLEYERILFSHKIQKKSLLPQICGHIHPGYYLANKIGRGIRLPSFVIKKNVLYLPAFSAFTGLDVSSIRSAEVYYPFTEKEIYCFPK